LENFENIERAHSCCEIPFISNVVFLDNPAISGFALEALPHRS
jgi:hypothetical protein